MNPNKKAARITGTLFLVAFAGVVTVALTKPLLEDPGYLTRISAHEGRFLLGALFQFIMSAACAGIAIALYPVLKNHSEPLALGAVGFRIIEGVFGIVGMVLLLVLLSLSRESIQAGAPEAPYFATLGRMLLAGRDWSQIAMLLAWNLAAIMYYVVFFRTELVPLWLSVWGLVGIFSSMAGSLLFLFHVIPNPLSSLGVVLSLPIALQELVLAAWLIVKGFDPSRTVSGSPQGTP